VANLGGSIDKFDIDVLCLPRFDGGEDRFSNGDSSLSCALNTTLDEEEVLVDFTVVREATHGGDILGDSIGISGSIIIDTVDSTSTNSIDLLVHVCSRVVAKLTASSDSPLDGRRMPGSDTGDLSETSMRFSVQSGDAESLDDTGHTLTLGNTDGINALRLLEDLTDANLLFELVLGEVNLLGNGTTVNLDLHDVSLVLTEGKLADLSGADDTDDGSVLLDSVEVSGIMILGVRVLILLLDVLGESLLLGIHPVLVESALDIGVHVLGEDGSKGTETTRGLNVADNSNDLHGWALNDGGGVHNILLDGLLTLTALLILNDVGHASLIAHEGSKVDRLGGIIAGE